jgi:hypothetical protein
MTLGKLREACVQRFGVARAPSPSGLYRYWLRIRPVSANAVAESSLKATVTRTLE